MREFAREGTGIRFGTSTGMGLHVSSNGNGDGNWYTEMGGENPFPHASRLTPRLQDRCNAHGYTLSRGFCMGSAGFNAQYM